MIASSYFPTCWLLQMRTTLRQCDGQSKMLDSVREEVGYKTISLLKIESCTYNLGAGRGQPAV